MKTDTKPPVIIIAGPTASGKSALAVSLALKLNGVIINADSSQVYKEARVLTAQPTNYEQQKVPHKLFGIYSLQEDFSVSHWLNLALAEIDKALNNNLTPILVGGNGFYLHSLINGISKLPEISPKTKEKTLLTLQSLGYEKFYNLVATLDPEFTARFSDTYRLIRAYEVYQETGKTLSCWQKTPKDLRLPYPSCMFTLLPPREVLYPAINQRFLAMLKNGGLEEAVFIKNSGIESLRYKKVLGLNELIAYLNNKISLEEAIKLACQKTRNYAKRQITWFKNKFSNTISFSQLFKSDMTQQIVTFLKKRAIK